MHYLEAYIDPELPHEGGILIPEPVIPTIGGANSFTGLDTFNLCTLATIKSTDIDPDELLDKLTKYYPGIPNKLLEFYLVHTLAAAEKYKDCVNHIFRLYSGPSSAVLHSIHNENGLITLWDNVDTTKYL
jgi:hypothetical protein